MISKFRVVFIRNSDSKLGSLLVEPVLPWGRRARLVAELRMLDVYIERVDTTTTTERRFMNLKVFDQSGQDWSPRREREIAAAFDRAASSELALPNGGLEPAEAALFDPSRLCA